MKCIDSIEGTAKCILDQWHALSKEQQLDDSEYVRNAKAVIDATARYLNDNPELVEDPGLLSHVLYVYSRNLWLMDHQEDVPEPAARNDSSPSDVEAYQTYYYDFLYHHGVYPR